MQLQKANLCSKGRPAPEDLQLIGLPARTARSGHQKHIRMLEHCWRFSTKAGEDFGVSARHMGVVWCESCNVHDPVVLRRVGQKAHACFFILHWQGKVDTLWSWGCMTEFAHGTGLPKWLLRFEISWSKEEPAYTGVRGQWEVRGERGEGGACLLWGAEGRGLLSQLLTTIDKGGWMGSHMTVM